MNLNRLGVLFWKAFWLQVGLLNSLGIHIKSSGAGSLLKNLLGNAYGLISWVLRGNLNAALGGISGVSDILTAVQIAYESVVSGGTSFVTIINNESTLKVQILGSVGNLFCLATFYVILFVLQLCSNWWVVLTQEARRLLFPL